MGGQSLEAIRVVDENEGPVLAVLGAAGPSRRFQDGLEMLGLDGPALVVPDGTKTEDQLVGIVHTGRLGELNGDRG
jgi:hypothetical protein